MIHSYRLTFTRLIPKIQLLLKPSPLKKLLPLPSPPSLPKPPLLTKMRFQTFYQIYSHTRHKGITQAKPMLESMLKTNLHSQTHPVLWMPDLHHNSLMVPNSRRGREPGSASRHLQMLNIRRTMMKIISTMLEKMRLVQATISFPQQVATEMMWIPAQLLERYLITIWHWL